MVPVRGHDPRSAFTLMEVMVALAVSSLILGGVMTFLDMASKSLSGTASQTVVNQRAGNSSESIFRRVRFATSVSNSNDASGNTLRLGFDDDSSIDRNNDGKSYNDQDHYEVFQFQNGDGSDDTIADNSLIYRPREDQTNFIVFVSRNRPLTTNTFTILP